jgi:hypothetical protein
MNNLFLHFKTYWLRAKSKRTGLHGIGLSGGGEETILRRVLFVNDGSS